MAEIFPVGSFGKERSPCQPFSFSYWFLFAAGPPTKQPRRIRNFMRFHITYIIPRNWLLILVACLTMMFGGCGGGGTEVSLDPLNLLSDYQQAVPRHHPYDLVEIDLGKYELSIAVKDSVDQYRVEFTAAAIVPKEQRATIEAAMVEYQTRIRDVILSSAQNMNVDNISDPHQAWLKSEILAQLARMLKSRDVRDVVFSDYTFERS